MLFRDFSLQLEKIEAVSSRLQITAYLAELFQELTVHECQAVFNLLQGQLCPPYLNVEFQLSDKMIVKALARLADQENLFAHKSGGQASAANLFGEEDLSFLENQIRQVIREKGDLGAAVEQILFLPKTQKGPSINEVYQDLLDIAAESGLGSQDRKLLLVQKLLQKIDALSARYVVRIIVGKMRLGFSLMTILDALSWAVHGDKSDSALLENAFQKKADLAYLARQYLFASDQTERMYSLDTYQVEVGIPVVAALCQRLNTAADIIAKMGEVYAEPKYDGMRVQIHYDSSLNLIRAFTRNLEDVSHMFPELESIKTAFPSVKSVILDSEAIGFDPITNQLLPFQETITRKRKHEVAVKAEEVPIRFFVFDLLALNGLSLIDEPLSLRKMQLKQLFTVESQTFVQAPEIITADPEELRIFHTAQLEAGLEGAVVKQINSVYQSGRKGWAWVKIKEEEGTRGKLSDTLDLVVMGLYAGQGKRHDFGVGAFLVGIRAQSSDEILTLSKIGTGLTDDQFRELKSRADSLLVAEKPSLYRVDKSLTPDFWLEPKMIVEIAADEITTSSLHTSGLSLRFPRLIRWRDDKNIVESTSMVELIDLKTGF